MFGLWGCGGGSDTPPLGQVSGTVTLDGQPLEQAQVTFQPENGRASIGETDSEGNYELSYTGTTSGALLGAHQVVIISAVEAYSDESGEGKDRKARPELLPAKYNSKTTLKADVKSGSNQIDFPLTSK
ncbi:Ig-like domain-containing protein [Gimesia fumaroli]|nr:Ig-like domain-containing protein [Gimesia fumaroli]